MVPFLVVLVHHVHRYRSASSTKHHFLFSFPVCLGSNEDSVYKLKRSLPKKPGDQSKPLYSVWDNELASSKEQKPFAFTFTYILLSYNARNSSRMNPQKTVSSTSATGMHVE